MAGVPGGELWPAEGGPREPGRAWAGGPDHDRHRSRRPPWRRWAGRFGGIAALHPRTGEIRALAGVAFSAPQPPGSTFKIVTATAALEAGAVRPRTAFPVETRRADRRRGARERERRVLRRDFRNSFAHSCNSVFAPLGVKVGARRLVDAALRYG